MSNIARIDALKKVCGGYCAERLFAQLDFAIKLSAVNDNVFENAITSSIDLLESAYKKDGALTKDIISKIEGSLSDLSPYAKKLTIMCVSHAHIDMNWMWDYSETVAITLETFRTMLTLMEEYKDFTFSQSQASVYRIVEKHEPEMLEKIKNRIKEGRWEVAASTWVEADKNMPNGESHARHILYTRRYLTNLLDLSPDTLLLDFEPDTFGHNRNVPEILSKGGIKYYYHCRGYLGNDIYKWKSPSGRSILVYKDPMWYNEEINYNSALYVPEFCKNHGIDSVMKVYGVGDHGGGPTRKDIEMIIDMNSWPIFPNFKFSTYREFFNKIEEKNESWPIVEGELNFVFTGCYTTQSRIKTANRIGESKLYEAETLSSLASVFTGADSSSCNYEKPWRKVLFNQFHDILPGSGVVDTREYAMGEFQKVLAFSNTGITKSMRYVSQSINSDQFVPRTAENRMSRSEGGGVGFEMGDFNIPHTERGTGLNRIINIFNTTQFFRKEIVEILVWDWDGDRDRLSVKNSKGEDINIQVIDYKVNYWAHYYTRILIDAEVEPFGYSTYAIYEKEKKSTKVDWSEWPRVERPDILVMENERIRTEFDSSSLRLKSLIDKINGSELINYEKSAGFSYIDEDTEKGMTAWVVGRHLKNVPLNQNARMIDHCLDKNSLRQWIKYEQEFYSSKISVKISLDRYSNSIDYAVECDWQEKPVIKKSIPQLNFSLPLSFKSKKFRYDIPFGTIDRGNLEHDVPANSWMAAIPEEGDRSVMLISKTKYGFRGTDSAMSLTLLRSSYDPDPYPELGIHKFSFAVAAAGINRKYGLIKFANEYNHKLVYISGNSQKGNMPLSNSFIKLLSENAIISAIKMPEDLKTGLIVRLYESEGKDANVILKIAKQPVKAIFVDLHEQPIDGVIEISGDILKFKINAFNVETILIEF